MTSSVSDETRISADGRVRTSYERSRWKRFVRLFTQNRAALVGSTLVATFLVLALVGAVATPHDPNAPILGARLQGPSLSHPMGTDELGRDIFSRIAVGARYSLFIGVSAVAVAFLIGVTGGIVAGYRGGWWDIGLMRLVDVLLTLPTIVLAIAIVSVLGAGISSVVIAVGITSIPTFARLARAVVLTLREQDFIAAARVIGAGDLRIMARHLLPNALAPLIVQVSLGIGAAILTAAALGFLGLGVQPPAPEWGAMLSRGRTFISSAPHMVFFPGLAIALVVLGLNLFGDGLRDALDPRMRDIHT